MKKVLFILFALFTCAGLFAQQPVVAVAPFDAISGVNTTEAGTITDLFFNRLGNTRQVNLVNRSVVERVLREHSFQAEDWSDTQKTAELGKALNADWIVQGNIRSSGGFLLVIVSFYDIKTFEFKGGSDIRLANRDEAYDKITPLIESLIQTISANPSSALYKIGERGPGGGYIFSLPKTEFTWSAAWILALTNGMTR